MESSFNNILYYQYDTYGRSLFIVFIERNIGFLNL